jgi:hypothetical protein
MAVIGFKSWTLATSMFVYHLKVPSSFLHRIFVSAMQVQTNNFHVNRRVQCASPRYLTEDGDKATRTEFGAPLNFRLSFTDFFLVQCAIPSPMVQWALVRH